MANFTFPPKPPQVLATAAFTRDMVETLDSIFEAYAKDGVLTLEVTTFGLWLPIPNTNQRQFLGAAHVPARITH